MRQTVLITGGTGMVGRDLLPKICCQEMVEKIIVVTRRNAVLPPHRKIEAVRGDVSQPDLGLQHDLRQSLAQVATTIIHGAAETSFSSELSTARVVNVGGTENVLRFASDCPRLKAFCHLSTVYVCGKRTGTIREEDLEHSSGFVNAYEQSKYEAEQLVVSETHRLPTTIVRLSTILGRSGDGAVTRSGAIHYALRFFFHSLAPLVPGKKESPVDLIALDYAADSIALVALHQFTPGSTWLDYHPLGYEYVFEKETPTDCPRAIAVGPIHRLRNGGQKDMPKVTESALVAAPAEKVFQMFIEPQRAVMFVPGLSRINNISPDKRSWDYEFNWLGLVISGHSECTAFEAPKRYQFKTLTGNKSTWTYRCEPDGANTKLSLEVEYEVPQQQLARFASETVLQKMNQNTAREIVSHIKTLLES